MNILNSSKRIFFQFLWDKIWTLYLLKTQWPFKFDDNAFSQKYKELLEVKGYTLNPRIRLTSSNFYLFICSIRNPETHGRAKIERAFEIIVWIWLSSLKLIICLRKFWSEFLLIQTILVTIGYLPQTRVLWMSIVFWRLQYNFTIWF